MGQTIEMAGAPQSATPTAATPQIVHVGPDRVTIKPDEVIIEARHRLDEWKVRDINPWPVYFNDKKYNLVCIRKGEKPYEAAYILIPWPEDLSTTATGFYTYDAEAVTERGEARRSGQMDDIAKAFMIPFYPLLGLFWSKTQRRLSRFGFEPHAISGISIFMVFCMVFAQGVFAIVTINGSIRSGKIVVGGCLRALSDQDALHIGALSIPIGIFDSILVLLLLADFGVRYTNYLREHDWCGGFGEWIFRRGGTAREV
jgi:hypothetical protein